MYIRGFEIDKIFIINMLNTLNFYNGKNRINTYVKNKQSLLV